MNEIISFFEINIFENSLKKITIFLSIILVGIIFKRLLSKLLGKIIFKFMKKYSSEISSEKFISILHKPFSFFILLLVFYIAFIFIKFPESWNLVSIEHFGLRYLLITGYEILLLISFVWIGLRFIDAIGIILMSKAEKTESKTDDQLVPFAIDSAKVIAVIIGIFFLLGSIFKMNVASLIAGLGIGGLAIALAAKENLENLLGSFTIFLDKPFLVGDLITTGNVTGFVEKIGFRSTRIRTLEKSYLTVPNKKIVDNELDNLSLRTFRRVNFNIGLNYNTSASQIKSIVADIQFLLDHHEHTNQDGLVKFNSFGDSALNVSIEYFIDTMDYRFFMNVREEINFSIMETVEKHKVQFAFPSRNIYLHQQS